MITPLPTRQFINKGELQIWKWTNVKTGDELDSLSPGNAEFTIQVTGIFGSAFVTIEGTLDELTFGALPRGLGEPANITASGIFRFHGPLSRIRPKVTGADETTNLNIFLAAVRQ